MISAHGMLEAWSLRQKALKKQIYSLLVERCNLDRAHCLRALTRFEAEDYRRFGLRQPIVVIPNGVDVPQDASPTWFFDTYPQLRGKRVVLFLGRIHVKKGVDLLCRAWAQMRIGADKHLVIAGPDSENTLAGIRALVDELGLTHSVTFTGMLTGNRKWSALAAAHTFVLPSHSEGFSVSVLEALGLGVPAVISRACNFPEVDESKTGKIIDATVDEIASALSTVLSLPTVELQAMGERGKALVRDKYQWNVISQQFRETFDWMLGGSTPTSVELLRR
jgi:glycosyltransferase involved in cell wall biosynthesis